MHQRLAEEKNSLVHFAVWGFLFVLLFLRSVELVQEATQTIALQPFFTPGNFDAGLCPLVHGTHITIWEESVCVAARAEPEAEEEGGTRKWVLTDRQCNRTFGERPIAPSGPLISHGRVHVGVLLYFFFYPFAKRRLLFARGGFVGPLIGRT